MSLKSYLIPVTGEILTGTKKKFVFGVIGLLLLITGSMFAVDWLIFLYKLQDIYYAAVMKIATSFLSFVLVIGIGKNYLDKRDRLFLLLAFCCMFPTDVITCTIGISKSETVSGNLFMVAGILSILAHFILMFRHSRKLPYFKKIWSEEYKRQTFLEKTWILWVILGSAVIIMVILWRDMVRIDHQVIGPIYTLFFCVNTWLAWQAVRYRLYPFPNGLFTALAMTGWYFTEVIGEISNIEIGAISGIAFNIVWVFYGSNVILVALSGYRWN